jgi:hypothetical protein
VFADPNGSNGIVYEMLSYTYHPQGTVNTAASGAVNYVSGTDYDAADRLSSAVAAGGGGLEQGDYSSETYTYNATTGNLSNNGTANLSYAAQSSNCPAGALSKAHAATSMGSWAYCYDLNGNMNKRTYSGSPNAVYNLTYDAENRLVSVSGAVTATFVYDGDGNRVKGTIGGVTTAYVGDYYEWTSSSNT